MNLFHLPASAKPKPVTDASLDEAIDKIAASRPAVKALLTLMSDGQPRIDEEMAVQIRKPSGGLWSPDTVRHARLALQSAGKIAWTGEVKNTAYGKASCVWRRI